MELLKKPLNLLEVPISPFIQKIPPRFVNAGKKNQVNVGEVMRQQETNEQSYQHAVNAVSRQENQYRYGQRSYFGTVMKDGEFRPPLIDPEFDLVPLSRLPRPRTQARTNPGGNDTIYHTQNSSDLDVSSFIDDRRIQGNVRPSFGLKMEKPSDYEIVPDLEYNAPPTYGPAGASVPVHLRPESDLECIVSDPCTPHASASSGIVPAHIHRTEYDMDHLVLECRNPNAYAHAGTSTNVTAPNWTDYEDYEIDDPYAHAEAYAGMQGPYTINQTTPLEDLNLESKTAAYGVFSQPSQNVDTMRYEPQETRTINRVSAQAHASRFAQGPSSVVNNMTKSRYLKPTLGYVGNFDSSRSRAYPGTFNHVGAHLRDVSRPVVSVTS